MGQTTYQKVFGAVLFGTIALAFVNVWVRPAAQRAYDYVRDRFADEDRMRRRTHDAIFSRDAELLGRLVRSGRTIDHSQVLCEAIEASFVAGVETALKAGASPNVRCRAEPALHVAAAGDRLAVVTLLLGAGADVNALNPAGQSALHLASCKYPRHPATEGVLEAAGGRRIPETCPEKGDGDSVRISHGKCVCRYSKHSIPPADCSDPRCGPAHHD